MLFSSVKGSESDSEIPREQNISPEKGQKINDDLRLILSYINEISENNKFVR